MDVGNLISGSSVFSKFTLNIWKFMVHVLLKPDLENFEHYLASVWDECNCAVVWTFFGIVFLWDWNENWLFQSYGHFWVFQICWHIECSTFTASSFRIWNSSTGIPSPPLALFIVILPKAHLTLAWGTTKLCLGAGMNMNTGKPGGQLERRWEQAGRRYRAGEAQQWGAVYSRIEK